MNAGPEAEFFLFQRRNGEPTTETHDAGGYFDLAPVDLGEDVRREIVLALEQMGFHVEAAHHEVAPGQHEIDFRYDDVLTTADNISTFRFVVKNVAHDATACTRRSCRSRSSASTDRACTRTSRCSATARTRSTTPKAQWQLSATCLHYIGGLLRHAQGLLRDHQPAGELVQAAGAGLRGADEHRVVGAEPQPARARAGDARRRRRASSCACRIRRAIRTSRSR